MRLKVYDGDAHIVEPADVPVTAEQEQGILAAVAELDAGEGIPLIEVARAIWPNALER